VERRASWRLTFVAWSLVLLLLAIVTSTIDYDTLVLIRELAGKQGNGAIALVALVIALPVLIDAVRNAPSYRQLWKRTSVRDRLRSSWSSRASGTTPRRCRQSAGSASKLTWRERAIVEQGQLAYGVVEHHGHLSSVRYDAPWGEVIASRPVVVGEGRPREGSPAALLFEPGALVGVAPTLRGIDFYSADARDERVALSHSEPISNGHPPPLARTMLVHATLHPVQRLSRYNSAEVGELSFDGVTLTLSQSGTEPSSVRLDKPFQVALSTFVLSGGRAELNVRIEPTASSAYRAGDRKPVQFKTELAQGRIARGLQTSWCDACYLEPRDFDALWAAIVDGADDPTLTASVSLS
jgi:hypothetical protein